MYWKVGTALMVLLLCVFWLPKIAAPYPVTARDLLHAVFIVGGIVFFATNWIVFEIRSKK